MLLGLLLGLRLLLRDVLLRLRGLFRLQLLLLRRGRARLEVRALGVCARIMVQALLLEDRWRGRLARRSVWRVFLASKSWNTDNEP